MHLITKPNFQPKAFSILLDNHLKHLAKTWNYNAVNVRLEADASKQVERFGSKLKALTAKEKTWSDSWKIAVAALGFEAQTSTAAVDAAVKVWRNLPAGRIALESDRKRVNGMDRDFGNRAGSYSPYPTDRG